MVLFVPTKEKGDTMSDSHRRYCAIKNALAQLCPNLKGHKACHLLTLTALICGIVGSHRTQLPAIASKVPGKAKRQSRITSYERFLKNKAITIKEYYLPYVQALLKSLPEGPLLLVIDGSQVGRNCMALVISVLYQKRALPLCWLVVKSKKGHLLESLHVELVEKAQQLLGPDRQVTLLGDGEFDGTTLLETVCRGGWEYVCRTAKNICLYEDGQLFGFSDLCVREGEYAEISGVEFTLARYGPVTVIAVWESGYLEPLYLVTNMELGEEALLYYRRRYGIETFFSDQKSRGFHLAHSHLSDPERLTRLMIASCLAYIWMVCLGVQVKQNGRLSDIHRSNRCDLSLFQIGLIWLEHCLTEGLSIWVGFKLPRIRLLEYA
jgi:Transposase DDE domain